MDSIRNEGKDAFEINSQSGEVFTKQVFDREQKGAFALEVEARDGAPSARPNSGGRPNTGREALFHLMNRTFRVLYISLSIKTLVLCTLPGS